MIIKKGLEFVDESGDFRVIRIEGKHFSDFAVSILKPKYDEDGEPLDELEHDHDTIMTASEIKRFAGVSTIYFEEDDES